MSNLFPDIDEAAMMLVAKARMTCREWARVRVAILPIIENSPRLQEFDKRIFALGEIAFAVDEEEVLRE